MLEQDEQMARLKEAIVQSVARIRGADESEQAALRLQSIEELVMELARLRDADNQHVREPSA